MISEWSFSVLDLISGNHVPRLTQRIVINDWIKETYGDFFEYYKQLKWVDISNIAQSIGFYDFQGYIIVRLEIIQLQKYLMAITQGCFDNCSTLRVVREPNNINFVEQSAFQDLSNFQSIINDSALFYQCSSLPSMLSIHWLERMRPKYCYSVGKSWV